MNDEELKNLFNKIKTIAVVGLSENPERPSHKVACYLQKQGYRILPVNPKCANVCGERCYSDLKSVVKELAPIKIDVVDIFRRSELVPPHVDEAIEIGVPVIWMQEGVEHHEAAKKARDKGISVIMNKCMMKEHQRLKISN